MTDDPAGERMAEPMTEPPGDAPDSGTRAEGPGAAPEPDAAPEPAAERRPALERIGLAAIAVVMAVLFGAVAVVAFAGGEFFLAAMGAVGCMMTLVVGGTTLLRG